MYVGCSTELNLLAIKFCELTPSELIDWPAAAVVF